MSFSGEYRVTFFNNCKSYLGMEQNGELNANTQTLKKILPLTVSDFLAWSQASFGRNMHDSDSSQPGIKNLLRGFSQLPEALTPPEEKKERRIWDIFCLFLMKYVIVWLSNGNEPVFRQKFTLCSTWGNLLKLRPWVDRMEHRPVYRWKTGACKSSLLSFGFYFPPKSSITSRDWGRKWLWVSEERQEGMKYHGAEWKMKVI